MGAIVSSAENIASDLISGLTGSSSPTTADYLTVIQKVLAAAGSISDRAHPQLKHVFFDAQASNGYPPTADGVTAAVNSAKATLADGLRTQLASQNATEIVTNTFTTQTDNNGAINWPLFEQNLANSFGNLFPDSIKQQILTAIPAQYQGGTATYLPMTVKNQEGKILYVFTCGEIAVLSNGQGVNVFAGYSVGKALI
jgi:hypothetical protein